MSFVVPGEPLAVEEEALPVAGAYTSRDGYVRAMIAGSATLDKYRKVLYVKAAVKRELLLRPGALVEGVVVSVSSDVAVVKLYGVDNVKINATGLLHVSQIASECVVDIHDYVRPSDVIKAKVLNSTLPYLVSIKEPITGVILAYCSNCGNVLYLHSAGYLKCKNCGRQEKRKIAVGYLYVLR